MRILFIDFSLPYLLKDSEYPAGGWATQLLAWINGLSKIKVDTGVLSWKGAAEYVGDNAPCRIIDTYPLGNHIPVLSYLKDYMPALKKGIREYAPDVIIQACAGTQTGVIAYLAKSMDIPFVHRVANDRDVDDRINSFLNWRERIAYKRGLSKASAVLCQNTYQESRIRKKYPNKPILTIANPSILATMTRTPLPQMRRSYIAWIGRFVPQKNLEELYCVASAMRNHKFKIAGDTSSIPDQKTSDIVKKIKALENVEMTGFLKRSEIQKFLSKAHCLVSVSHYEGFSNVFLEAFAAGTPVLAYKRIDPDSIIEKHELGKAIDNNNDFANELELFLAQNDNVFEKIADNCVAYLEKNHTPEQKAKELTTFLSSSLRAN